MNKFYLLLILILLGEVSFSQSEIAPNYQSEFNAAYTAYPELPRGILESVAWAQTRINHRNDDEPGCIGLPVVSGVMGLVEDGQGYFKNTLLEVANSSGYSVEAIKTSPAKNILAYAKSYAIAMDSMGVTTSDFTGHAVILQNFSEIPQDGNPVNNFASLSFVYEVFQAMKNERLQDAYAFPVWHINYSEIFGEQLDFLTAQRLELHEVGVLDPASEAVYPVFTKSAEYGPALWNAAPSCNYSSRSGTAVSAVTVHTIQGSYYGAISWAQNCISNVSYHYVARSSDGQITQMLLEEDKGWHVGSHNPYTIGIEHEGYVDDASWYTEAMYIGSSDLVRDITESGYGINPLRTYHGAATAGINVLGSCIRIKGHQHYSGGTHTDPGINWDWEHYYQLINDDPSTTTLTTITGVFTDSGGSGGDYGDDERELYLIQPTGAVEVTIDFTTFDLEEDWDYLYVYDGATLDDPLLATLTGSVLPTAITSSGGSILLEFRSDCNTTAEGWEITWTSDIGGPVDITPPVTVVDVAFGWKTTDFTANFADTDETGGSGVDQVFYQVIDYNGTEWRANADLGFFSDNFDGTLHPEWTNAVGTWDVTGDVLVQSDEAENNSNLYATLNQDDFDTYLYHWQGNVSGVGTNKRCGFHFMCDDATLPNRGNSYFVWFREDDDAVQIYKVVGDVFTLEQDITYTIDADVWYDFKVVFDKPSGEIEVWLNNEFLTSWVDDTPLTSGNAISMRSGNSNFKVNNLKVYHNRATSEIITVGPSGAIRYQNPNPGTPSGKVKSMIIDAANNVSGISAELVNVDWTAPADVPVVNDGIAADLDVTATTTELSGNWTSSSDPHSGLAVYYYAIGTAPGSNDVVDWTDNWLDTTFTEAGLSLAYGTLYYISVYAVNDAGLESSIVSSDGILVEEPTAPPTANYIVPINYVCEIDSIQLINSSLDATDYAWSVPGAIPATSTAINPYFTFPSSGTYTISLTATGPGGTDVYSDTAVIEVQAVPEAIFSTSETVVAVGDGLVTFTNTSLNSDGQWWDFGDGNVSSDDSPWNEYTAEGTYTVMMIALNGTCPNDTAWTTVVVAGYYSVEEFNNGFEVYPNPTNGSLFIKGPENWTYQPGTINLYTITGQEIAIEPSVQQNTVELKLPDYLPEATYILSIQEAKQVSTIKVVLRK